MANGEYVELLYPAVGGVGAEIAQNHAPIKAIGFLGANANRKAFDILVGLAGTYGQRYIPSSSKAGMRMAAAGAAWDLAKTFYGERSSSSSSTGADVAVLDYGVPSPTGGNATGPAANGGQYGPEAVDQAGPATEY